MEEKYLIDNKVKELFYELGEVSINNMNNIYIHQKGNEKFKIMIMAHADEVFLTISQV